MVLFSTSTILLCATLARPAVAEHARIVNVPEQLAFATVVVESGCYPRAVSTAGARGMMQILPFWTRVNGGALARKCGGTDLHNIDVNLCYGTRILRHYYARCRGRWDCALRKYSGNAPGYRQKVVRVMRWLRGGQRRATL